MGTIAKSEDQDEMKQKGGISSVSSLFAKINSISRERNRSTIFFENYNL